MPVAQLLRYQSAMIDYWMRSVLLRASRNAPICLMAVYRIGNTIRLERSPVEVQIKSPFPSTLWKPRGVSCSSGQPVHNSTRELKTQMSTFLDRSDRKAFISGPGMIIKRRSRASYFWRATTPHSGHLRLSASAIQLSIRGFSCFPRSVT